MTSFVTPLYSPETGLSLHWKFAALDGLTGQRLLVSISQPWVTVTCHYLRVSAEDSNSGPYACRESILISWAVSQIPRHLREA